MPGKAALGKKPPSPISLLFAERRIESEAFSLLYGEDGPTDASTLSLLLSNLLSHWLLLLHSVPTPRPPNTATAIMTTNGLPARIVPGVPGLSRCPRAKPSAQPRVPAAYCAPGRPHPYRQRPAARGFHKVPDEHQDSGSLVTGSFF